MKSFIQTLSSILFDENQKIKIITKAFKSSRFGIPVYSGAILTPELSNLILRAKEDNDLIARKFLATLVIDAMDQIPEFEPRVIPIPSRRSANWERGFKHTNELLREVAKLRKIEIHDILKFTRNVEDQSKLNSAQRLANLNNAFSVSTEAKKLPTASFLIDDLITSGATIQAAAKALQVRNIQLLGAISACATSVFTE